MKIAHPVWRVSLILPAIHLYFRLGWFGDVLGLSRTVAPYLLTHELPDRKRLHAPVILLWFRGCVDHGQKAPIPRSTFLQLCTLSEHIYYNKHGTTGSQSAHAGGCSHWSTCSISGLSRAHAFLERLRSQKSLPQDGSSENRMRILEQCHVRIILQDQCAGQWGALFWRNHGWLILRLSKNTL